MLQLLYLFVFIAPPALAQGLDTGLDVDPSYTTEGEVWTVIVTPVDPDGPGDAVSESVTIENSLPIVDSVDIVPDDPTTSDDVEAVFTAHDPDGGDARDAVRVIALPDPADIQE